MSLVTIGSRRLFARRHVPHPVSTGALVSGISTTIVTENIISCDVTECWWTSAANTFTPLFSNDTSNVSVARESYLHSSVVGGEANVSADTFPVGCYTQKYMLVAT